MIKSYKVFYDSKENIKKGILRMIIILPIFLILNLCWNLFTRKLYKKHIDKVSNFRLITSVFIIGILFSFIGIHVPLTKEQSILYGAVIGLVIYGIVNMSLLATSIKWNVNICIIDIIWGVISTGFLGYILYIITEKYPDVLKDK